MKLLKTILQTKTTIDQLQSLVSTDSRFRNMRDAINRCDPPSIPYVGMYLTDLSFIEEGTPNYSSDGLLNFSKMRMVSFEDIFFNSFPLQFTEVKTINHPSLDCTCYQGNTAPTKWKL